MITLIRRWETFLCCKWQGFCLCLAVNYKILTAATPNTRPHRLSTTTAGNANPGPTGHGSTLPPPPPGVPGVQTFIYPFEYFYSILTITSYNVILTYFVYRVYKNSWSYWVYFWLHSIYWCVMLVIIMLVSLLCMLPDPSYIYP